MTTQLWVMCLKRPSKEGKDLYRGLELRRFWIYSDLSQVNLSKTVYDIQGFVYKEDTNNAKPIRLSARVFIFSFDSGGTTFSVSTRFF